MERTPDQQLKYAKRKLREEKKLLAHFEATAVSPPHEKQQLILQKQREKVDYWDKQIKSLNAALGIKSADKNLD